MAPPDPTRPVAFFLCGGVGSRLRPVADRPKAVIEVAGWPFLHYPIETVRDTAKRLVFLTGSGADQVERVFGPASDERIFMREEIPLGTGGAVANARRWAGEVNWVANGDSFVEVEASAVLSEHRPGEGLLVAVRLEDVSDYGSIDIDAGGRIRGFIEKGLAGPGWINAGIYVLDRAMLTEIPEGPSSLEREHLPRWAREGRLRARAVQAFFRDIGTPERLRAAQMEFPAIRSRLERRRH